MIDFNKKYNREDFISFLTNFLPDDYEKPNSEDKRDFPNIALHKIKEIYFLGECKESLRAKESLRPKFAVFEVIHESEYDPRVTLTKDIFNIIKNSEYNNALVVFVSKKSDNWRLSLITSDIVLEEGKIKEQFSNPKRFSFYLGPDAKVKTPTQFLIQKGKLQDLDDLIKNRFSIEPVNKEFYIHISKYFNQLVYNEKNDRLLKLPSVDSNDYQKYKEFAIRLIGRIIFIWFLKCKKTPNNIPLIPSEVISSDFVKNNDNYYHNYLEKLFFEVLNTQKEDRKDNIFPLQDSIPFLNGGLFYAYEYDFYDGQPQYNLEIPNKWFIEFFEGLERFNFTIDENITADIDLSIDPEMLGKIFEELLAKENLDTQISERKSTGSYYTPREIVNYMVDNVLIEYLISKTSLSREYANQLLSYENDLSNIDEKIKDEIINALHNLKIIDPACGSGAFTMGVFHKILLILQKVDPNSKNWLNKKLEEIPDEGLKNKLKQELENEDWNYIHKLGIMEKCIYGVDIQPMAIDISKLRFFLSLIVDSQIDDTKYNRGIQPLPNLDFKFICANTLIPLPKDTHYTKKGSGTDMFSSFNTTSKLKDLISKYFYSSGEEKEKLKSDFKFLQSEMVKDNFKMAYSNDRVIKLGSWQPFENAKADWFDPEWMFGITGFDLVIGNPPYIQLQKNSGFLANKYKDCRYKSFERTGDIYCLFYEKGNEILKDDGHLIFITSNKWMRSGYGEKLREYLSENTTPKLIVDLGPDIFDSATVDTNILLFQKGKKDIDCIGCKIKTDFDKDNTKLVDYVNQNYVTMNDFSSDSWLVLTPIEKQIKQKIEKIGTPLKDKDWDIKINRGITTGYNEAFIIDGAKKDELIKKDPKNAEIIKPILRGKDIKRYYVNFADKWLIVTHNGYKKENGEKVEAIDIENYPAIKKWLDLHWEKISKRDDQGKTPYNLRNCAYQEEFEKEKII